jgi:hypothetical protein
MSAGSNAVALTLPILGWFFSNSLTSGPLNYVTSKVLRTWRGGGMEVAFAAAGTEVAVQREKYQGAYLLPVGRIAIPSSFALDVRLQTELYESTEKFIAEMV